MRLGLVRGNLSFQTLRLKTNLRYDLEFHDYDRIVLDYIIRVNHSHAQYIDQVIAVQEKSKNGFW